MIMSTFSNVTADSLRVNDIIRTLVPSLVTPTMYAREIVQITEIVPMTLGRADYVQITYMTHAGLITNIYHGNTEVSRA